VEDHEDDDRHAHQHRQQQQQPAREVALHLPLGFTIAP
jgi:hypothetical protein